MLFSSATGAGSSSALHPENYAQVHLHALERIETLQRSAKASPQETSLVEMLRGYIALRQILKGLLERSPDILSAEAQEAATRSEAI